MPAMMRLVVVPLGLLFGITGVTHFVRPSFFTKHVVVVRSSQL